MMKMIITGTYNKTLFRNEKNGFTRFSFISSACSEYNTKNGELICAGYIPIFTKGIPLKLNGTIVKDEQWNGKYVFTVIDVSEYAAEREATIAYISGKDFLGIGGKMAEKIINITGTDIFKFIRQENAKEILRDEIVEFRNNESKLNNFYNKLKSTINQQQVYLFLNRFGGNYVNAVKLCELYGTSALTELKKNCYVVGYKADIPFVVCDAIAKSYGKMAFNEQRITTILIRVLSVISNNGHTYSHIEDIMNMVNKMIKASAYHDEIPQSLILRAAQKCKSVIIEKNTDNNEIRYYLSKYYNYEQNIAKDLLRLQNTANRLPFNDGLINEIGLEMDITYSEKQKYAFNFMKTSGVKILTGGPGTGKTTILKGLISCYKKMNKNENILLCAPTGRAAQKITEATGMKALTMHRALEFKPFEETMSRNKQNPLNYGLIIVDEMSMTDITIFSLFLDAVKNGALLILCGDSDQLPSVGPGSVLKDIINSKKFEFNALDVIYRQGKHSNIVENSLFIKSGKAILKQGPDFKIITKNSEKEIRNEINTLTQKYFDQNAPFAYQVLCPTKKGDAGTIAINKDIQSLCNKRGTEIEYGVTRFSIGDKVMTIRNNYENNYVNGDIGIIKEITNNALIIEMNNEMVEVDKKNVSDVILSYASTIHKSQGSEYDVVVVSLPSEPSIMLKRKLLYTAISRAKKTVIIVEQKGSVARAIENNCVNDIRMTSLSEKICERHFPVFEKI